MTSYTKCPNGCNNENHPYGLMRHTCSSGGKLRRPFYAGYFKMDDEKVEKAETIKVVTEEVKSFDMYVDFMPKAILGVILGFVYSFLMRRCILAQCK